MEYEWDEHKNQLNIAKHGIDFNDAWKIFLKPVLKKIDNRVDYREQRWIGLGEMETIVVVIIFTERNKKIRIISIRRANRYERKVYQEKFS